jgi:uncharacterized protein YcbK (DUF882 family)
MGDLSEHFSKWELACRCGCGFDDVDPELIRMLEEMRGHFGGPITINSGCRCLRHNMMVGGNPQSEHLDGQAADLAIGSSNARFRMVEAARQTGFRRLGIAKTFIHVDTDLHKPQDVIWLYS